MKTKLTNFLSFGLVLSTILSNDISSFAYDIPVDNQDSSIETIEYQSTNDNDFDATNIFAQLSSIYKVTIPKTIVLNGIEKKANYLVKAEGDIAGYETLSIVPDDNFELHSTNKNSVLSTINQDKTAWHFDDFNIDANGSINANDITAGKWTGAFNFNINLIRDCKHNFIIKESKKSTCKTEGYNTYECKECKKTYTEFLGKGEHDITLYKTNVVEPTCTTDGSYELVEECLDCKQELSRTKYIVEKKHNFVSKRTSPTCTEPAHFKVYCSKCGFVEDDYVITGGNGRPALGHNYVNGKCTRCGKKQ